ncbi:MAG TPA: hypothetical protein PK640_15735 [Verrucomicrobiota bacterium]|nr:hypothetical protein [Verrucomicrobiota bacterium]
MKEEKVSGGQVARSFEELYVYQRASCRCRTPGGRLSRWVPNRCR